MNKLEIIGNLTRDPETRYVNDKICCTFTVAVNRRVRAGAHPQADYVRVTAWEQLGERCDKYLTKGKKVYAEGTVRAHAYIDNTGQPRAALELSARDVEFLSPKGQAEQTDAPQGAEPGDWTEVDDDELPFN